MGEDDTGGGGVGLRIEQVADAAAVTVRAGERIADWLREAVDDRGTAVLALSGGSTPAPLYAWLARADLHWSAVHVVQVDERIAPAGDAARNWTAIAEGLVDPAGAIGHPMPVESSDPTQTAASYAAELASLGGLDVVHLGLGADGHTASLVPADPVLSSRRAVDVTEPYQGHRRMTLTAPTINAAGRILWQVSGGSKAAALQALRNGEGRGHPTLPCHLVRRDAAWAVVDQAAAARL